MLVYSGEINDDFLRKLVRTAETASLVLCSTGGDCAIMAAAIDTMGARNWRVHVLGACMSAAVPLVALGARGARTAAPSTRFMVHLGKLSLREADVPMLDVERGELERYEQLYATTLGRTTKHRARWWRELMADGRPHYFSAEEALRLGLVDAIQ